MRSRKKTTSDNTHDPHSLLEKNRYMRISSRALQKIRRRTHPAARHIASARNTPRLALRGKSLTAVRGRRSSLRGRLGWISHSVLLLDE